MNIGFNISKIRSELPDNVKLVAVSKFHPKEAIQEAYDAGQKIFGESRVQELILKQAQLPEDIEWHFIGHLQTNKVKTIVPYIHTIHSIDSWKLINEIEKQAILINREKKINCLLEIHIAQEDSKYGLTPQNYTHFLEQNDWKSLRFLQISGVMGIASNTDDENQIKSEFNLLRNIFEELKKNYFNENKYFSEISMGMSHDFKIAIEEGSTMVRIGSSIFGDRI